MSASGRAAVFLFACAGAAAILASASPASATFSDVTSAWGFFGGQPTWGVQIIDPDRDGDLDVFNAHHFYSGFLFTNDGHGNLTVWGMPQLLTFVADRHGYLWADFDNDGNIDVACSHGSDGGCPQCTDDGNELWKGVGNGTFLTVANAGGMYDQPGRGRAFAAADIDGDGDLDIFHAKAPLAQSPNSLYRNDGNLSFVDVAADWGVAETLGTVGGLFADYDNDGDPDLFVAGDEFGRPTKLFRNDNGHFTDVTLAAFGSQPPIFASADFGDFDNDGDLDLVAVEGSEAVYDFSRVDGNVLTFFSNFRFNEDGVDHYTFETPGDDPVAALRFRDQILNNYIFLGPSGVHPPATASTVTLTDAYVGAPTYTPGVSLGLFCWRESPGGPWHMDISGAPNTFGNFDGTVTAPHGIVNSTFSNLEQLVITPSAPHLYRNDGGVFTEVGPAMGLAALDNPRHVTWVDYDLDGDLDMHVVVRGSAATGNPPDQLLRNDGDHFTPVQGVDWAPGFNTFLADGAAWGDLDRDGDPDVIVQEGSGALFFTVGCPGLIYRNDGPTGHGLTVQLQPPPGGRTAVGAKVDAWSGGRRIHRRLTANAWRGFQNPMELYIGVGNATTVDSIGVTWTDGTHERFGPNIPTGQVVVLVPGQSPTAIGEKATPRLGPGPLVPQPARDVQTMNLYAPQGRPVQVDVFDTAGRRVRNLGSFVMGGTMPIEVRWDGRDDAGRRVAAGVYFLRGRGGVDFQVKSVRLR